VGPDFFDEVEKDAPESAECQKGGAGTMKKKIIGAARKKLRGESGLHFPVKRTSRLE